MKSTLSTFFINTAFELVCAKSIPLNVILSASVISSIAVPSTSISRVEDARFSGAYI